MVKNKKVIFFIIIAVLILIFVGTFIIIRQNKNETLSTCIVQFESSGGTKIELQEIEKGLKAVKPEDPVKKGFTFIEWQLNGETYNFESIVNSNITLTAVWKANDDTIICTVTFDSCGGSAVDKIEVSKGQIITPPINPKKSGYSFMGWYYNENLYDFSFAIVEDITLIAKWEQGENKDINLGQGNTNNKFNTNIDINSELSDDNVDDIINNMLGNWYWEKDGEVCFSARYAYINNTECIYFEWNNINLGNLEIYSNNGGGNTIINKPIAMASLQTFFYNSNIKSVNSNYLMIGEYKFIRTKKTLDLSKYNDYVGTWYLIGGDSEDNIIITKESDTYYRVIFKTKYSYEVIDEEITQKNINENQTIFDKNGISYSNGKLTVNRKSVIKIYSKNKTESKVSLQDFSFTSNIDGNTINVGETAQYHIKPIPNDATDTTGSWYSENTSIAAVDSNGLVIGVSEGSTAICFTSNDGNITNRILINVDAIKVKTIDLEKTNYTVIVGNREKINYSISPNNATNKEVEFTVSSPNIISIENGYIVANNVGTVTLSIKSVDRNASTTCTISVLPKPVEGITLNKSNDTIYVNDNMILTATILPSNATNKTILWTTSDSNIATVDSNGKINGKQAGTAIITATTEEGGYTASCTITVKYAQLVIDGEIAFTRTVTNEGAVSGVKVTAKPSGGTGVYNSYNIKLYYNGSLIGESSSNTLFVNQSSNGTYSATITVVDSNGTSATVTKTVTKS